MVGKFFWGSLNESFFDEFVVSFLVLLVIKFFMFRVSLMSFIDEFFLFVCFMFNF